MGEGCCTKRVDEMEGLYIYLKSGPMKLENSKQKSVQSDEAARSRIGAALTFRVRSPRT